MALTIERLDATACQRRKRVPSIASIEKVRTHNSVQFFAGRSAARNR